MNRMLLAVSFLFGALGMQAGSPDSVRGEVAFTALTKAKTVKAGMVFELELKYQIAPDWHIGPSKSKKTLPTDLEWTLPKGVKLVKVKWPELNYFGKPPGYQGVIIVTAKLQAGDDLAPDAMLNLRVRSSWQVCKGICKLGEATRSVKFTVSE